MGRAWRRASLVLIAAHDVFIYGGNGNGATAMAMIDQSIATGQWQQQLQWHWGTGAGAAGATGGNGNGAMAIVPIAMIDHVPCAVWMWGAGMGVVYSVFYSKR